MTEPLHLDGLDGANPLGFLAALGTLALSERLQLRPRMAWRPYANSYRPMLWTDDATDLADKMTQVLKRDLEDEPPAWCAGTVIKRPAADYRRCAGAAGGASRNERYAADFAAAFASDAVCDDKSDSVTPTRFSFANGQSGKVLLRDYRDLVMRDLNASVLERTLLHSWKYDDACKTFRWEPRDLRLYALRADDPGASTVFSSIGGNVLAFWGLVLLPSFPTSTRLITTGFSHLQTDQSRRHADDYFTWPIWDHPATPDVVRSLLAIEELQRESPERAILCSMGIPAIFRSRRLNYQKSLYFLPAEAI